MKKRMAAVVLALMVAGALTACSGSKTETKDTQATTQAKETEAKQTEAKQTEAKQTEAKQTEAKQTEAKQTEAKQTEAKQTEAKQTEAKQTEAKETEAKETEAKETEAKQTEAKETEAKETEAKTTEAPKTTEASETEAAAGTEAEEQLPDKAEYTIYNQTGEAVTSIQFYQNDIKKMIVSDGTPLADGESRVVTIEKDDTVTPDTTYSFSFQTEGGYVAFYRTLHFEIVPMTLIAEDAKTGATPFQFAEPEVSATEATTEAEAEKRQPRQRLRLRRKRDRFRILPSMSSPTRPAKMSQS